jgi:hypothetical protein
MGRPAGPWWAGTRDDAGPSCTIAPGRRTASPLHAPRARPSPGAARRPLPARERRLFFASLGTGGSFLSARSTDLHTTGGQCRGDPPGRPLGAPHPGCAIWDTHEDAILDTHEDAILDTHESLRGLKVGCCHRRQPAGKSGPDNIHDTRGNARTSPPPAKPRPRTSRQGPTTNPAGKEANREQAILGTREFVCGSGKSCPRISVRVPKLFSCCETARSRARSEVYSSAASSKTKAVRLQQDSLDGSSRTAA